MPDVLIVDGRRSGWEQKLMVKAAEDARWEIVKILHYDEVKTCIEDIDWRKTFDCIRTYGSIEFTQFVNQELNLGLTDCPEDFLCFLPLKYVSRAIGYCRSDWLKVNADQYFSKPLFIKPPRNKEFPAQVYNNVTELPESMTEYVLCSKPVKFELEIRCFVRNNRLLTYSPYMLNMEPIELIDEKDTYWSVPVPQLRDWNYFHLCSNIEDFMNEMLDNVDFPKSCVVDIGLIDQGSSYIDNYKWAVVELNNPFSSGLYDCDPAQVLRCLEFGVV